jgi:tetratricopeptide (TPR) repeat protein
MLRIVFMLAVAAILAACSSGQRKPTPAPVESRTVQPEPNSRNSAAVTSRTYVYRAPQIQALPQPKVEQKGLPSAARNLLKRAQAQQQAGDYPGAAASLERSLRIAPRNAQLWHELAMLRTQQKRYAEVEQLAAKSNALAADSDLLKNKNWQLIAQARAAQGDHTGAAYARQQIK